MAYDTSNPPRLIVDHGLSGSTGGVFLYSSTDAHGTVSGAGYFSDGSRHGMKVGDAMPDWLNADNFSFEKDP